MKEWTFRFLLLTALVFFQMGCENMNDGQTPTPTPCPSPTATASPSPTATASPSPCPSPAASLVVFTPVGDVLADDLVDLEFLPGQNGDSIAITLSGTVFYLRGDFTAVAQTASISVDQDSEQGLLNVAADPDYATNKFIYLYFTVPGSDPDINRVDRFTVTVNKAGGTFSLGDRVTIISFNKNQSPNPGSNHNGGSMVFNFDKNLLIGVGDGGDGGSTDQTIKISQNPALTLGKIHRIIPSRQAGVGGFTVPSGQPFTIQFNGSPVVAADSVFSIGVRNPFTMVLEDGGDIFFGDVGNSAFEEINCAYAADAPENYGWPQCEGPCAVAGFVNPIHSYAHGDDTFNNEDPEDNPGGHSIMVNAFYNGDAYGPDFKGSNGKIIYSEFFGGWVRLATLNAFDQVTATQHIGHQGGLTGLHVNPVDDLLYGTSLGGSNRILRLDLAP